jgi:hypothetical protein
MCEVLTNFDFFGLLQESFAEWVPPISSDRVFRCKQLRVNHRLEKIAKISLSKWVTPSALNRW